MTQVPDTGEKAASVPDQTPENDNQPDVAELPPEAFFHWYNFAFLFGDPKTGTNHSNVYWGLSEMKITGQVVAHIAKHVAPEADPRRVVLMGVSYMGYMTKEEMDA